MRGNVQVVMTLVVKVSTSVAERKGMTLGLFRRWPPVSVASWYELVIESAAGGFER